MSVQYCGQGSFILGQTCWEEFLPWLRPHATDFLQAHLPSGAKVFEYGAGASTVWLARQGYTVLSCELDAEWVEVVRLELERQGLADRARVLYFSPQTDYLKRLQDYADHLLTSPAGSYDLVLIDGRNRARCLGNARPFVKPGGYLCLDNAERLAYDAGRCLYHEWPGWEWGDLNWLTTIWQRPLTGEWSRVALENADA